MCENICDRPTLILTNQLRFVKREYINIVDAGILQILETLDKTDKALPVTIIAAEVALRKEGVSTTAAIRRIDLLLREGLLEENKVYSRRYIKINESGKKVLEHLKEIEKIISESRRGQDRLEPR